MTDVMTRGKRFISIVAWHGHLSKISGADRNGGNVMGGIP